MKAAITASVRSFLEPHLPHDLDVAWFTTPDEARARVADADIAWIDYMQPNRLITETLEAAGRNLK